MRQLEKISICLRYMSVICLIGIALIQILLINNITFGGILIIQACTGTNISTALIGLVLILGSSTIFNTDDQTTTQQHNNDNVSSSSLSILVQLYGGLLMFFLSCVSEMILFWPEVDDDDSIIVNTTENIQSSSSSENNDLETPLLHDNDDNAGVDEEEAVEGDEDGVVVPSSSSLINVTERTRVDSSTRRLMQLASTEIVYLYAGCLVLLCRLPFSLAIPHFVSTTITALANGQYSSAKHEIFLLFISGTIDAVLDFWGFFLFGYANQRIVRGLRINLFHTILGQEIAYFDVHTTGELTSRLNSDCSEMANDLTWFFRFSIESIVRITGITIYMLIRSPILGACALCIVPAVAIINKLYGDWLRTNAIKVQDALADANSIAQEVLSNIRTVIAFATEDKVCNIYENKIHIQYLLNIQQLFMQAFYYMAVSTFLINTVVQGTLLFIGMHLIEHNKLEPGVLLAFMLYQSQLQNETLSLMNSYTSLIKSTGAGDKVFKLLDRLPPPPGTANEQTNTSTDENVAITADNVNNNNNGSIEQIFDEDETEQSIVSEDSQIDKFHQVRNQYGVKFENVTFHYPSRPDNPVLLGINLIIPQGKTVALVGKSGCGKTTIVNLLQRFYDPDSGTILINGKDLRELNIIEHRKHIGVVTQDPALFRGTIYDNIIYGDDHNNDNEINRDDVYQVAEMANADTFIRQFQNGYDTEVGERAVQLSGGQKQRIAIARALYKAPSLLLLDEATSALDQQSEEAVQNALDRLLNETQMTTIIIAHRLRTVRNADKIVVLERGKVVEEGTHQQLMEIPRGVYRKMVKRASDTGVLAET